MPSKKQRKAPKKPVKKRGKSVSQRKKLASSGEQPRDVLFSSLAQATRELLLNPDMAAAIGQGLRLLGEATKVDRVYLFENNLKKPGEELTTSQRYEWNSGTSLPQINNPELQNLPYSVVKESYKPLSENKPYVQIVSKMDRGSTFRKILQDEDIKSILLFPIFVRDHFWGFVGFDECKYERVWSEIEFSVLASYSATISGALSRMQIEQEVERALQSSRETEQRFRILQEASFGGIGLHDKGVIIDCNQGLCDLTGYSYEELIGFNGLMLIPPEFRKFVLEKIASDYDQPYDVECLRKDGTRFALEVHGKSIPYNGKIIRVTEFRDVTDRKRSEEKIREQNSRLTVIAADLKRKNDQLEEFAQIVSHNLRAPIGNILSLISFYEESHQEAERKEYFDLLKASSHAVHNTFNELVEVLKIRQNTSIEKQELSFATTLEKVKKMFVAKINETQAIIKSDFQVATINYPNIYLESIFLNLLSNSLKYQKKNVPPEIIFKTYEESGDIILEVADNGLGIDLERYGHQIFKLNKTFHLHTDARGIGLFITKNQIEAMGGEIKVFSKVNEGATFVINFTKYAHR